MKNYREIADSVFARREQYVTAQRKRKKLLASAGATLCAVSLLGGSVWYLNRPQHDIPVVPATDDGTVTTTVTTEGEDTTTTTVNTTITTIDTTTDGGIVTPPTTAPAPSKPTGTKAPTTGKTEPPKSTSGTKGSVTGYIPPIPTTTQPTTSTGSDKLLITGDEQDNHKYDESTFNKAEKYITPALQKKMNLYKGTDVIYAVIVTLPVTNEDMYDDFWTSTEELVQFRKEYQDARDAYREEAWQLNPSWDGKSGKTIEVWTDSLREKYEYWLSLIEKEQELNGQPLNDYLKSVLAQRLEALKAISEKEPIYIASEIRTYYVELTAEAINTLAEQGGYVFRLASKDQKDYGSWDFDE